jgi:hypothetical protein
MKYYYLFIQWRFTVIVFTTTHVTVLADTRHKVEKKLRTDDAGRIHNNFRGSEFNVQPITEILDALHEGAFSLIQISRQVTTHKPEMEKQARSRME